MDSHTMMVIHLIQIALLNVNAIKEHYSVSLKGVTLILAKLIQMDISSLLMALHLITMELVNMC